MDIYRSGIRPVLFSGLKADPEWLHQSTMDCLTWLSDAQLAASKTPQAAIAHWINHQFQQHYSVCQPALQQTLWGISFPNPIGLAAGFDKDGTATGIWPSLGFGFVELGTVTAHAQPGNPKPRLFRLLPDEAVLNRMGFNNRGAAALAERLQVWRDRPCPIPMGINLGKSKITELHDAPEDYRHSFRLLKECGHYFVVNVSSPNTPGLRSLQATDQLEPILDALMSENNSQKPFLVKIAPDLENDAIAAIVDLAQQYQFAGIIATNTTIQRAGLQTQTIAQTSRPITEEAGGISGAPLRSRSTDIIRFIWNYTNGQLPIIGVGGIFTAEDAWEKITAGASLVQVYTGLVYEGPAMLRRVSDGLVDRLHHHGMTTLTDAIGSAATQPVRQ
jgi:dihydroorotate dehydrogenase